MITGSLWASYFFFIVLLTVNWPHVLVHHVEDVLGVTDVVEIAVSVVAVRVLEVHALLIAVVVTMAVVVLTALPEDVLVAVLVPPMQEALILFFKSLIKRIKIDINMTKLQVLGELL